MTGIRRVSQLGTTGEPIDNLSDVAFSNTVTYGIGSTGPAGGIIFITPSTVGNTTGKWFELVPASHTYLTREWSEPAYESTSVTGADGTAIGTGYQNTLDIIAQGNSNPSLSAAKYCDSLTIGGFSDWFLPSKDELTEIYTNLTPADGMYADYNWSSTEYNSIGARYRHLGNGEESFAPKLYTLYVSPVRMFEWSETVTTPTAVDGDALQYNGAEWVNSSIVATPTNAGVLKGMTGDLVDAVNASGDGFQFTLTSTGTTTYLFTVYSTTLGSVFGPAFSTNFIAGKILDIFIMGMMGNANIYGATITSVSSTTISLSNPTAIPTLATSPTDAMFAQLTIPLESVYGFGNTFLGNSAGVGINELASFSINTARNVAIGEKAMAKGVVKAGGYYTDNNIAIGPNAGNNFYGTNNIFIGRNVGNASANAQGSIYSSTFIGYNTGAGVTSSNGLTLIGNNMSGAYPLSDNDAVVLGASGTNGIRIKNTGAVTMPNQPAFRYHGWTMTTSGLQGGTAPLNKGNSLSIGSGATYSKFTAPVAGLYFFGASCLIETGTVRVEFIFTKNGSATFDGYDTYAINDSAPAGGGYTNVSGSYIFQLAAGDYIGMTPPVFGTLHGNMARGDRMFYGYLIG